jgi:hypothetical protein
VTVPTAAPAATTRPIDGSQLHEFAVTTSTAAGTTVAEHPAPTTLTVEQAHRLMQVHLECSTTDCAARRTALILLVAQRRYVLDLGMRRP